MTNLTTTNRTADHDNKIIAGLDTAQFTETDHGGEIVIQYAHLRGTAHTCDGVLYWSVSGIASGEKMMDGNANWKAYGRACIRNEMMRIADRIRAGIAAARA